MASASAVKRHTGPTDADSTIDASSRSALTSAKRSLRYLYSPGNSPNQPDRRRTRVLLRFLRSATIFVFWKLVRWAKYAAIASLVAAVGAGAVGTAVSGVGFVLAPTGIMAAVLSGSVWGIGRMAARRVQKRWGKSGYGEMEEEIEESRSANMRKEVGPEAIPW
ncbi:hypothetical protein BU16DRAFT_529469 [Lophium mytilinum]|uniref:Uncharacterized protein n=1 Tax=Lophium mytilinum TaxID=390894 RepID=A0A6A6QI35_9PEZI|nr:hypothetical protein BU16DRAFT_529469 [Lophium mytilinum]